MDCRMRPMAVIQCNAMAFDAAAVRKTTIPTYTQRSQTDVVAKLKHSWVIVSICGREPDRRRS